MLVWQTPVIISAICSVACFANPPADQKMPTGRFFQSKTFFQTNTAYDPRLAIAVDAVVVHRHGDGLESLKQSIGSWQERGFVVGRMFFSDSDATNVYWKGKWDGTPHEDEVERDAAGNVVQCSGIRPYMLPTDGWTRHLEEMTRISVQAGADAVLPEEPLAHSFTGYEGAFKPLFERRFGIPWQPESASPEAHFLTCQLKTELYLELEQRLARVTKAEAARIGKPIDFLLPVHPLYSNRASRLVAPMGAALGMKELDGYVGQVWTGPVNWALANYSSPDKSFFTSAYALYDYFAALTDGTDKKMWMLADPVEDDPNHKWSEFELWYRHCLAAKLMFPRVENYEVMPWPDRIFLPGYQTGGGTPAPEPYRVSLLSAIQVLQDIPALPPKAAPESRIGVAVGDSALWMPSQSPVLDGLYGLILPLLHHGIQPTVSICERWTEPGYLDRFKLIVLSYENFVPTSPEYNLALLKWIRSGGTLLVVGGADELKGNPFWWTQLKCVSALDHLLAQAKTARTGDFDAELGKGRLIRRTVSPRQFARDAADYLALINQTATQAHLPIPSAQPGFSIARGQFRIVHALREPMDVAGPVVDIFDPELPVLDGVKLAPGHSGIYRDVSAAIKANAPAVLHCTHRLMDQHHDRTTSRLTLRGPAGTPAVVRLFTAGRQAASLIVRSKTGEVPAQVKLDEPTRSLQIRFENLPEGATIELTWKSR